MIKITKLNKMKKASIKLILALIFPFFSLCFASANVIKIPESVFEKNGNIYISYVDKSSIRITDLKVDNSPQLSYDKKFIVFLRKVDIANKPSEDNLNARFPILLIYYDIALKSERILAKSCYSVDQIADKYSSTTVEDGDKVLCCFSNPKISLDNKRVYIESFNGSGGNSGTTNYVELSTNELHYFAYGHLESIQEDGNFKMILSNIEMKDGISQGRQWKTWLYDKAGKPIKLIDNDSYRYNSPELITAEAIVMMFKVNEKTSYKRFLNKIVDIKGLVIDSKKDLRGNNTITLKSDDPSSNVFITMIDNQNSVSLKNKFVTIRGTVTGFLSDLVVNNGKIIKVN